MRPLAASAKLAGLTALAATYALAEAHWYKLRLVSVPVLPPEAAPFRLLHLSDLHLTAGQGRKAAWIADLANLEPDLVISTGDHISAANALDLLDLALGPLLAFPGGFVFGSNDFFAPHLKNPLAYFRRDLGEPNWRRPDLPVAELRQRLSDGGWVDLNNARSRIRLETGPVELVGLGDPHLGFDQLPEPNQASGFDGQGLFKLGVVHAPYIEALRALVSDGAQLVLAGHTHGGQVALPVWGALVSNSDLPAKFAYGLHPIAAAPGVPAPASPPAQGQVQVGQSFLHVSAGLGTSPYSPIRFSRRPEATLLTLVPRRDAA